MQVILNADLIENEIRQGEIYAAQLLLAMSGISHPEYQEYLQKDEELIAQLKAAGQKRTSEGFEAHLEKMGEIIDWQVEQVKKMRNPQ
jgi:hypothetical protein